MSQDALMLLLHPVCPTCTPLTKAIQRYQMGGGGATLPGSLNRRTHIDALLPTILCYWEKWGTVIPGKQWQCVFPGNNWSPSSFRSLNNAKWTDGCQNGTVTCRRKIHSIKAEIHFYKSHLKNIAYDSLKTPAVCGFVFIMNNISKRENCLLNSRYIYSAFVLLCLYHFNLSPSPEFAEFVE